MGLFFAPSSPPPPPLYSALRGVRPSVVTRRLIRSLAPLLLGVAVSVYLLGSFVNDGLVVDSALRVRWLLGFNEIDRFGRFEEVPTEPRSVAFSVVALSRTWGRSRFVRRDDSFAADLARSTRGETTAEVVSDLAVAVLLPLLWPPPLVALSWLRCLDDDDDDSAR